jgi:hypothetical protein
VLDEGAYPARLVQVIDMGLQPQRPYQGQEKAPAYMITTIYESSDEFMADEDGNPDESKPRWFWEELPIYNLDQDKAKSTKRYYALDPNEEAGGDWSKLIGNPVNVALTISGEYNNIGSTSTMRPKEAQKLPPLVNEPKVFDLGDPDVDVFLTLPQRLQDKIKNNLNFEGSALEKALKEHTGKPKEGGEDANPQKKKSTAPAAKSGVDKTASHSDDEDEGDDNW